MEMTCFEGALPSKYSKRKREIDVKYPWERS